jgi:hypothetical protein
MRRRRKVRRRYLSDERRFGWGYPAGAENDPRAPYNQPDLPDVCPQCGKDNRDDDGGSLYDGVFCSEECKNSWEPDFEED